MQIPERANQDPVFVLVAPELIAELGEWSRPVQVRVERRSDGGWEMTARAHECQANATFREWVSQNHCGCLGLLPPEV